MLHQKAEDRSGCVSEGRGSMSRKGLNVQQRIRMTCARHNGTPMDYYSRGKALLECYRDVCWDSVDYADDLANEFPECCGRDMDTALLYLDNFAPDGEKERFEERFCKLFDIGWRIRLVDMAMYHLREWPKDGKFYGDLISLKYLSKFEYTLDDMLDMLGVERSTFYRRQKEAVTVFGVILWGTDNYEKKQWMKMSEAEPEQQLSFKDLDSGLLVPEEGIL